MSSTEGLINDVLPRANTGMWNAAVDLGHIHLNPIETSGMYLFWPFVRHEHGGLRSGPLVRILALQYRFTLIPYIGHMNVGYSPLCRHASIIVIRVSAAAI